MRPSIAFLILLFLVSAPVFAQTYEIWERPRNAVQLPVTAPVAVEIYLPQKELYSVGAQINPMMIGGIAGAIGSEIGDRKNDSEATFTASLQQQLPSIDYDATLKQAVLKHIGPAQLQRISRTSVYRTSPVVMDATTSSDPDEQTLALVVRYFMTPGLRNLRIAMSARLGPRSIVTSPPGKHKPQFTQFLVFDVPGVQKEFAREDTRRQVWADMGAKAISDHIQAGMDGVMAMLTYELGVQPRFGRITGKQIPWSEGQNSTFGIIEATLGSRILVRLRNGVLVSLPADDPRVRDAKGAGNLSLYGRAWGDQ